jgi:DNA-binding protein H-NS
VVTIEDPESSEEDSGEEEEATMPTQDEINRYNELVPRFNANRGWLTRWAKRVRGTADMLSGGSADDMMVGSMTKDLELMKKKLDMVEEQADILKALKPEKEDDIKKNVTEAHEIVREAEISAWEKAAEFKAIRSSAKCDDALKPKKLSKEFRPEEMTTWTKRYKEYFDSGEMAGKPVPKQRANLNSCLEPDMQCILDSLVDDEKRPIWKGKDSCIEVIKEQFMKLYPLYSRRQQFYTMECPRGQSMSEFRLKIARAAKEADIASMKEDDHIVVKLITACTDSKLKQKMLEVEKPTRKLLEGIIDTHESAAAGESSLRAAVDKANRATQPSRGRGGSSSRGGSSRGGSSRCATCGRAVNHGNKPCWALTKKCNTCRSHLTGQEQQDSRQTRARR